VPDHVRALLIDQSRDRAMLVAARSLAAAGFTVGTGAWRPSLASLSRFVDRHHSICECEDDEERFVADTATAIAEGGYDIVFCDYDVGLLTLSRRRAELAGAVWPYAAHEVVERSFDKAAVVEAAKRAGLGAPRTEPATVETIERWSGPVAVKARTHLPTRFPTALFSSAAEARSFAEEIRAAGGDPLLQEPLSGRMGAVVIVAGHDGETLIEVQQEAFHRWPSDIGDTVGGRVVAPDPALSRGARALVRDLGWFGLTQIEFIRDSSGVPHVTDFNGRFYGSLALATGAGANLPALWAEYALGRVSTPISPARVGATFQWLNRDLAAAREEGAPAVLRALARAPVAAHSLWNVRDPGPAVRYLLSEGSRRTLARYRGAPRAP
jgi:predicted ATP-grasp superfamily ATP-dependent carboligase